MQLLTRYINPLRRQMTRLPWERPDMEFELGVWRGVSAVQAISGRQIGEGNTRPFLFNRHIPAETYPCKYGGSRSGRPINMTALRIAMRHFDEASQIVGAVKAFHLNQKKMHDRDRMTGLWDLYVIAQASIAIIAYSLRQRHTAPLEPPISNALASQYQFITGVFMICRHMIQNNPDRIATNETVCAEELFSYADRHALFHAPDGQVCAGSEAKIMEFLTFCIEPINDNKDDPSRYAPLAAYVGDPPAWYRYACAAIDLDIFLEIAARRQRIKAGDGDAAAMNAVISTYERIRIYCLECAGQRVQSSVHGGSQDDQAKGLSDDTDQITQALYRQNVCLAALGRPRLANLSGRALRARGLAG